VELDESRAHACHDRRAESPEVPKGRGNEVCDVCKEFSAHQRILPASHASTGDNTQRHARTMTRNEHEAGVWQVITTRQASPYIARCSVTVTIDSTSLHRMVVLYSTGMQKMDRLITQLWLDAVSLPEPVHVVAERGLSWYVTRTRTTN